MGLVLGLVRKVHLPQKLAGVAALGQDVIRTALKTANLIGDGLYGVDVKQSGKQCYIIEVNDNPNLEAGVEDSMLKEELYRRIMSVILRRIERKKAGIEDE